MYPKGNLFIPASHGQLEGMLKEPQGYHPVPTKDVGPPLLNKEGSLRRGVAVVCHPHPLGGGTMHNKVVFRMAAGLLGAGLVTLRFNFRGVGASTGEYSDVEGGKEDVRDVLDYLASEYPAPTTPAFGHPSSGRRGAEITLAGFSFGSRTGCEVGMNDDRVARLISVGTPVDKYHDYDFLAAVEKPILFVHGDRDEFGSVANLRSLTGRIPHAEVVIFENCGHFFEGHLDRLRDTTRDWTVKEIQTGWTG